MKKILIVTLIGLTMVGCQKKDLTLKESLQITQEIESITNDFAKSLTGNETYDDILIKARKYADDVYNMLSSKGLQEDLTREDIEDYITNFVEDNFSNLKTEYQDIDTRTQEEKLQEAQSELDKLQEESDRYKAGSPIYNNRGF